LVAALHAGIRETMLKKRGLENGGPLPPRLYYTTILNQAKAASAGYASIARKQRLKPKACCNQRVYCLQFALCFRFNQFNRLRLGMIPEKQYLNG
jgi:hypothetical protein